MRLELAGGLYHVTSRGDGREDIYLSDADRQLWLEVLGEVCERFNWVCHAWCQMTNHYHTVIETPEGNLAQGMRQLNGVYTQRFSIHQEHDPRNEAMARAYLSGQHTLAEIARHFDVHYATVSRAVRAYESEARG